MIQRCQWVSKDSRRWTTRCLRQCRINTNGQLGTRKSWQTIAQCNHKRKKGTHLLMSQSTQQEKKNVTKKPDFQVKNQLGFLNQISESGVKEALPHKTYVQGGWWNWHQAASGLQSIITTLISTLKSLESSTQSGSLHRWDGETLEIGEFVLRQSHPQFRRSYMLPLHRCLHPQLTESSHFVVFEAEFPDGHGDRQKNGLVLGISPLWDK